jgi:hypothetical protein
MLEKLEKRREFRPTTSIVKTIRSYFSHVPKAHTPTATSVVRRLVYHPFLFSRASRGRISILQASSRLVTLRGWQGPLCIPGTMHLLWGRRVSTDVPTTRVLIIRLPELLLFPFAASLFLALYRMSHCHTCLGKTVDEDRHNRTLSQCERRLDRHRASKRRFRESITPQHRRGGIALHWLD